MDRITSIKTYLTLIFAGIASFLGVLAVPVFIMVGCNIIDYITGLMASTYRKQDINSYKSIRGITKKVCMWMLVVVGVIIDETIIYAAETMGISYSMSFLVACIVTLWIICNELISILENIKDCGVNIPKFLLPLVDNIKTQVDTLGEQAEKKTEPKEQSETKFNS